MRKIALILVSLFGFLPLSADTPQSEISFEKLVSNFSKIKNRRIQEDVAEKVSKLRERTDFIKNNLLAIMVNTKKKFDSEEIKELKRNGVSGIVLDGLRTDDV